MTDTRQHHPWRDSMPATVLDIVSKLFVLIGTPVIGWVLLSVVNHEARLGRVEEIISVRVQTNDQRLLKIEATILRMEDKLDRLVERKP